MQDVEVVPLDVCGLSKRYGRHQAVKSCSFRVPAGEVHGLLGPNGSGKSSTLHIITGLMPATSGSIAICGVDISNRFSRAHLGFAPDDLKLPEYLTGLEFLLFHNRMRERDDSKKAMALVEQFGIDGELQRLVAEYSHGMQRKLQIVAATMHSPDVVILDEPFRGLDPDAASTLRQLISVLLVSGACVLEATHDMLRAERDCDRVTILDQGIVVAEGAPGALITEFAPGGTLEEVFLSVTGRSRTDEDKTDRLNEIFGGRSSAESSLPSS